MQTFHYTYFQCPHCVSKVNCEICAESIKEAILGFGAVAVEADGTKKELSIDPGNCSIDEILDYLETIGVFAD